MYRRKRMFKTEKKATQNENDKTRSNSVPTSSAETSAALDEAKAMKRDPSIGKSYSDIHEMIDDLLK